MGKCKWCKLPNDNLTKHGYCSDCCEHIKSDIKINKQVIENIIGTQVTIENRQDLINRFNFSFDMLQNYKDKKVPFFKSDIIELRKKALLKLDLPISSLNFKSSKIQTSTYISALIILVLVIYSSVITVNFNTATSKAHEHYNNYIREYQLNAELNNQLTDLSIKVDKLTPISAKGNNYTLENGNFVAGIDFEAGTYDIKAVDGMGNISSDNAYNGGINAIMGTKSADTTDFAEQEYSNISLPDGTTLTIDGVKVTLTKVD